MKNIKQAGQEEEREGKNVKQREKNERIYQRYSWVIWKMLIGEKRMIKHIRKIKIVQNSLVHMTRPHSCQMTYMWVCREKIGKSMQLNIYQN